MRVVDLSARPLSAAELLEMARGESVLVKTSQGDSFVVSPADELATEVELLRQNHTFLTMLDRFKEDSDSIPLAEAEDRLR